MKLLLKTTLLLLALILPIFCTAHDFEVDGIYYKVNGNEATVTSGTNKYIGDVTIPSTVTYNGTTYSVTTIDNSAFEGCSGLTSINIGNSVTSIGVWAFDGCWSLTSINMGNSVTSIGYGAFLGCWNLTSIVIPNSVTSIGQSAFKGCTGLTSINIGNSVSSIGYGAFLGCRELTSIVVASSNPFYDSRDNCNAIIVTAYNSLILGCKNTIIPNTITSIDLSAFWECRGLTSIVIPNSVTEIGHQAFSYCSGLTNIDIPNSVISIGQSAFKGCTRLTNINIPNSVTSIDSYAFEECTGLTSINIPNSVTSIGGHAFNKCTGLTSINIGSSVTTIGGGAFYLCPNVTSINCFAANPPICIEFLNDYGVVFSNIFNNYSATLHIPKTSLAAYFITQDWCNFENIVGDAVTPTGISISRDSIESNLGEQFNLTATVTPANASNKDITWYSTDTSVATVEDGTVTAVGYGECDIYAYCFGMPAICHILVVNRISLDQQEAMLLPNHMLTLTPSASPVLPELTVTSSDPTVAAARVMNGKVQVVGVTEGTVTITVGSKDGMAIPATCLVTVYTEMGDVNMDGFVSISDVAGLINYLLNNDSTGIKVANADLDDNGKISISDVTSLIRILLSSPSDN